MKPSNQDIKKYLEKKITIPSHEPHIQKAVLRSQQAYYEAEEKKSLTKIEFLYDQWRYVQKRWWVIQGMLLALLWLFLRCMGSSHYSQRVTGLTAPLFILSIVPEIWKNKSANAMEVECTAFYSLREIYAARMILFAMVDLTLLTIFFAAASLTVKLTLLELIIHFFVPFNITCCICFRLLYSRKGNSQMLALFLCLVWTVVWLQLSSNDAVYEAISIPMWIAFLLLSALYLGYSIWRGQKNCIETWEGKTLWN